MKKIIVITTLAIIILSIFLVVSKNLQGRRVRAFSLQTPSSSDTDETNLIHRTEAKVPSNAEREPDKWANQHWGLSSNEVFDVTHDGEKNNP
ncbi:MAG: hypothetical protein GX804_04320 [Lentisphaerae bacterium]|jgi:hypothetical protein|nr:hypothetical protein [Lentisphaerota bacterium]